MKNLKKQLKISDQTQRTAKMLIDQQMWCWGCDVKRAEGNLLSLYGANKRQSPNPSYHSAYVFQLGEELMLNLWGWGLWIADAHHGSLFLARSQFHLRYIRDVILMPDAWRKRDLPLTTLTLNNEDIAHACDLLRVALHWIGAYEAWIGTQVTSDYREHVLAEWPQRKRYKGGIPATEMAEQWLNLAASTGEILKD